MDAEKIVSYFMSGKYVVWEDDKVDAPLTPAYLQAHAVLIADTLEYAIDACEKLHDHERSRLGRAVTRYRISSSALAEDWVCSEDLPLNQMEDVIDGFPLSPNEKSAAKEHLRKTKE